MNTVAFRFVEAMEDMGFRQNNGLACYDCGETMKGLRSVGKPHLCNICWADRAAKNAFSRNKLPVGPAV